MRVWHALAELFGMSFFREHGEKPGELWKQAIWRLTDQEITNGLTNLAEDGLEFPANCSQFVAACQRRPKSPPNPQWVRSTLIEDQRKPGKMPYAEWKRRNGIA